MTHGAFHLLRRSQKLKASTTRALSRKEYFFIVASHAQWQNSSESMFCRLLSPVLPVVCNLDLRDPCWLLPSLAQTAITLGPGECTDEGGKVDTSPSFDGLDAERQARIVPEPGGPTRCKTSARSMNLSSASAMMRFLSNRS